MKLEAKLFNLKNGADNVICPLQPSRDASPHNTLSDALVDRELIGFQTFRDYWVKPSSVNFYAITGYNRGTIVLIRESNETNVNKRYQPTCTTEGDETVPLRSAETVDADRVYFADFAALGTKHSEMVGNQSIQNQVLGLLNSGAGVYGGNITIQRPAGFIAVQCK